MTRVNMVEVSNRDNNNDRYFLNVSMCNLSFLIEVKFV